MEKSTIIKLRQQEATSITTNGSFSTSLQQKVLLEEGDVVKLHSAFIDTTTESIITVPEPIDVSFTCITYLDLPEPTPIPFDYTKNPSGQDESSIGFKHIACSRHQVASQSATLLESVHITPKHHGPGRQYGNGFVYFRFRDPDNNIDMIEDQIWMGTYNTTTNRSGPYLPLNILTGTLEPRFIYGSSPTSYQPEPNNTGGPGTGTPVFNPTPITLDAIARPIETNFSFQLGIGVYTPAEIAQIITDKCSELNSGGQTGFEGSFPQPGTPEAPYPFNNAWPVNSAFCSTLSQLYTLANPDTVTLANTDLVFSRENHLQAAAIGGEAPPVIIADDVPLTFATDVLLGTNNFSLNYDTNLAKLNFDLIHTPYQFSVDNVWTPGITYPAAGGGDYRQPTTSYSGIAFTKLDPPDFWHTLGFTETPVHISYDPTPIGLDDGTDMIVPQIILTPGLNITQQYAGLDLVWNKVVSSGGKNFYQFASGDIETQITTPIISNRGFNDIINDEGYYYLEVGIKIPQTLIGGSGGGGTDTMSNRVQAIVGKFYTSGYTLPTRG